MKLLELLSGLITKIASEYGVDLERVYACTYELTDMIFSLCSIVDEQRISLFGEILARIALLAETDIFRSQMHLTSLREMVGTCLLYLDRDFASSDATKITGRCILKLLKSMSNEQFDLFVQWNQIVACEPANSTALEQASDSSDYDMGEIIRRLRKIRSEGT